VHRGGACRAADAEPRVDRAVGEDGAALASIADVESGMLAAPHAAGRQDARERSPVEAALELHRRTPLAAPGERHRQPRPLAEDVHEAHARAVGEAVPVLVPQHRQPHRVRLEHAHRPRHRHVNRHAFPFRQADEDEHGGEIRQRLITLEHVHRRESIALLEASLHRGQRLIGEGVADLHARDADDDGVRGRVVAADFDGADVGGRRRLRVWRGRL
jgi:hypothetical protein